MIKLKRKYLVFQSPIPEMDSDNTERPTSMQFIEDFDTLVEVKKTIIAIEKMKWSFSRMEYKIRPVFDDGTPDYLYCSPLTKRRAMRKDLESKKWIQDQVKKNIEEFNKIKNK